MLKQTSQKKQRKEVKHSPISDFSLDLSKSMPNVTANKTKTGFKLQPKFIVTLRRLVSLTQEYWTWLCEIFVNTEPRTSSNINFYLDILTDNEMPLLCIVIHIFSMPGGNLSDKLELWKMERSIKAVDAFIQVKLTQLKPINPLYHKPNHPHLGLF